MIVVWRWAFPCWHTNGNRCGVLHGFFNILYPGIVGWLFTLITVIWIRQKKKKTDCSADVISVLLSLWIHTTWSSHIKSLYSPLLLKSSSSDSKKGSMSSMKSSNEKTGSASDSNEQSFCCGLCGNLLVFRDGLTPRCKGYFCEATWVMWTWLTGWWSFSLWTVFSEETERKVVGYKNEVITEQGRCFNLQTEIKLTWDIVIIHTRFGWHRSI